MLTFDIAADLFGNVAKLLRFYGQDGETGIANGVDVVIGDRDFVGLLKVRGTCGYRLANADIHVEPG